MSKEFSDILGSKVALVGGTSFDSAKGAAYLSEHGIPSRSIGISSKPSEQSGLYANPELLREVFHEKVGKHDFQDIVLYCNSLCFAQDWSSLYPGRIYELVGYYRSILQEAQLDKLAIIVAENSTSEKIRTEPSFRDICDPSDLNVFADIELIIGLEASNEESQKELIRKKLQELKSDGFEEVVFGCTHLDHPEFSNFPGLKIYQPGLNLLHDFIDQNSTAP